MVPSFARLVRFLLIAVLAAAALPVVAAAAGPRTLYVSNLGSSTITPIDIFTGTLGPPMPANTAREIAITPDGGTAYVVNQDVDTVTPFDTGTGIADPPIPVGDQPRAIAITPDGAAAYVAHITSNTVIRIDTATGTTGPPISIPGTLVDIAITPDGAKAYVVAQNMSQVTPIDTATGTAGTPIPVGPVPSGIAVTPDGSTAYVSSSNGDSVTPISTATDTAGAPIPVGSGPVEVAITPGGDTAYVANFESNSVTPIEIATNTPGTPIPAGVAPATVAVTPDGETAYVANALSNDVTPIDTASGTAGSPLAVGDFPWGLVVTPNQGPSAVFDATPAAAGSATSLDASGSTDSDGTVAGYRWDFGDGHSETTAGPAASHVYAAPGTYTVTLTVTDDEGCSTAFVFTGQTASCNGSATARVAHEVTVPAATKPEPPAPAADTAPPAATPELAATPEPAQAVERFGLASRCVRPSKAGLVRVGMTLRLTRPGPVRVQVQRAVGTRAIESCPKPGRGRRFGGRLREVQLRRSVAPRVVGATFRGRLTLRLRLKPGLYRITVRAYSGGGELSAPASRWLRVLG
jgi:YVTN family beta-propeller protein